MMTKHDFSALYARYPEAIAEMPPQFTSHQFILTLARQNQVLYIEALYSYRDSFHRGEPTPFRVVHQILAKYLRSYSNLVRRAGHGPSQNIFGHAEGCACWEKV